MTENELTDLIKEFAEGPYFDKANTWFFDRQNLMYSAEFSNMICFHRLNNYAIFYLNNYKQISISGSIYRLGNFFSLHQNIEIAEIDVNELRNFLNEQILNLKIFKNKEKLIQINQDFEK